VTGPRLRLVLVDDSRAFLALLGEALVSQGIDVLGSASDSSTAHELVRSLAPDAALVDIELGPEDGVELARELAASTRVILMSAHGIDDLAELVEGSAAVGFISKRTLDASAIHRLLASAHPDT
jgi:DNA-binding NarL/FixJ family response regulator